VIVLGVDSSLTGCGLVAVPGSWDLDWRRVTFASLGRDLPRGATAADRLHRVADLANDVCKFARLTRATHVVLEGQVARGRAFNVPQLCELIGVIRHELLKQCGLVAPLAPQSSVRKLLLGWLPAKERKAHVVEALKAAGDPFAYDDERDAFAVANWALHELAAPCLTGLLGEKPARPKTPRKRKGVVAQAEIGTVQA
jgi:Holliday junction resolvasome RuvABC endonuclease subunit